VDCLSFSFFRGAPFPLRLSRPSGLVGYGGQVETQPSRKASAGSPGCHPRESGDPGKSHLLNPRKKITPQNTKEKIMISQTSHFLASIAIMLPAFLISLSFHEFSHALAATLFGDNTPKRDGRLTLNPLAHVDMLGLLCLLLFRIGWAKPVIFDPKNFKYPKIYSILTALAGPCSNFLLAVIMLYTIKYFPLLGFSLPITTSFLQIFKATAYINIMLGVFNLFPIPPLDGSHILMVFLVDKYPQVALWIYRYSMFILLGLFILPQTRALLITLISYTENLLSKLVI